MNLSNLEHRLALTHYLRRLLSHSDTDYSQLSTQDFQNFLETNFTLLQNVPPQILSKTLLLESLWNLTNVFTLPEETVALWLFPDYCLSVNTGMPDVENQFSISWHALLQALNSGDEPLVEQALWCFSNAVTAASKHFVKTVFKSGPTLKNVCLAVLKNVKELFGVKQSALMCLSALLQAGYGVAIMTGDEVTFLLGFCLDQVRAPSALKEQCFGILKVASAQDDLLFSAQCIPQLITYAVESLS